jgi:hypothetical protein
MGDQIAALRAFVWQHWLKFRPAWRRMCATVEVTYWRLERAEVGSDWRKRPSNIGSVALHSLILIGTIIWAYPWAKAGGPSKVIAVQVIMTRPAVADATAAAGASQPRVARSPTSSSAAQSVTSSQRAIETVVASQPSSDLAVAAQQDATPQPRPEDEASSKSTKAATQSSSSNVVTSAKDSTVNGAPVAAGSQDVALQNALRTQMLACWNPPSMAGRRGLIAVDFDLVLNPDGTFARPPQLTPEMAEEAMHDPNLRAAAEAARQALKFCGPFKLPRDTYDQWREINPFHFDPAEFLN